VYNSAYNGRDKKSRENEREERENEREEREKEKERDRERETLAETEREDIQRHIQAKGGGGRSFCIVTASLPC